eukprot:scaffold219760_cov32-Prasinocladus_malaysianus.AAC.1
MSGVITSGLISSGRSHRPETLVAGTEPADEKGEPTTEQNKNDASKQEDVAEPGASQEERDADRATVAAEDPDPNPKRARVSIATMDEQRRLKRRLGEASNSVQRLVFLATQLQHSQASATEARHQTIL